MSEAVVAALREALGDRVHTDAETLDAHRRDYWALAEIQDMLGQGAPPPCAVVLASSTDEVSRALRVCREKRVAVIPFGGASGVCGAIQADPQSVVLSTRGLEGLVGLDDRDLSATFRAGTLGIDAENRVRRGAVTI